MVPIGKENVIPLKLGEKDDGLHWNADAFIEDLNSKNTNYSTRLLKSKYISKEYQILFVTIIDTTFKTSNQFLNVKEAEQYLGNIDNVIVENDIDKYINTPEGSDNNSNTRKANVFLGLFVTIICMNIAMVGSLIFRYLVFTNSI